MRISVRAVIVVIVVVVAIIGAGIQFLVNLITGCTGELKSTFEGTELAQLYEDQYLRQLKADGLTVDRVYWEMNAQGKGCVFKFNAHVSNRYPSITYKADTFYVNLEDQKIYPQSEGANIFMSHYTGSVSLETNPGPQIAAMRNVSMGHGHRD